jgi:hypothetical protein
MPVISLGMETREAAQLLVQTLGAQKALRETLGEIQSARRARNRRRFTFWTAVAAEIEALDLTHPTADGGATPAPATAAISAKRVQVA